MVVSPLLQVSEISSETPQTYTEDDAAPSQFTVIMDSAVETSVSLNHFYSEAFLFDQSFERGDQKQLKLLLFHLLSNGIFQRFIYLVLNFVQQKKKEK